MKELGIPALVFGDGSHLLYERYGWEFYCMVQGDGEPELTRLYIHHE